MGARRGRQGSGAQRRRRRRAVGVRRASHLTRVPRADGLGARSSSSRPSYRARARLRAKHPRRRAAQRRHSSVHTADWKRPPRASRQGSAAAAMPVPVLPVLPVVMDSVRIKAVHTHSYTHTCMDFVRIKAVICGAALRRALLARLRRHGKRRNRWGNAEIPQIAITRYSRSPKGGWICPDDDWTKSRG